MAVVARAPGKLVLLGEYAVLVGGPALVMAVNRHCVAEIERSEDALCHVRTRTDGVGESRHDSGEASGVGAIDIVTRRWPAQSPAPWRATLDSSRLHVQGRKLGLGSSAAALVSWAGAWAGYTGRGAPGRPGGADLPTLVRLHRAWQGADGSGLDVAASLLGGVLEFRLPELDVPDVVSVTLPKRVGFVGVSTGRAASTRDFLEKFNEWRRTEPAVAGMQLDRMRQVAELGVAAARGGDAQTFIAAAAGYGEALESLGIAIGADIVTAEHKAVAAVAARYGIAYKVSGAGGGDVGVGFAGDPGALAAFATDLPSGCEVLRLGIDTAGLVTEERAA